MNYSQLIQIVTDEAIDIEDSFLTTNIALIIERAQLRIQRDVDLDAARKEATVNLTGSQVAAPSDLVILQGLRRQNGPYLLPKDKSFIRDYWPNATATGTPKYYAWLDSTTLLVAPSTATSTTLAVEYTYRLPVLNSTTSTTNWLSLNVPDLLQMAVLYEAAIWSKDAELEGVYSKRYGKTLDATVFEQNLRRRTDEFRRGTPKAIRPQGGGA